MSVKENPRFNFKAARMRLILAFREAAPDEPIVMRYPIRVYQSDQSSQNVFSTLFFTRRLKEMC